MIFKTPNRFWLQLIFLLITCSQIISQNQFKYSKFNSLEQKLNRINDIRYDNPDNALELLETFNKDALRSGDTISAVVLLLQSADIYGNLANYANAYEKYWKALLMSEKINNDSLKSVVYIDLGRMYSFYKRRDITFKYFKNAIDINRELVKKGIVKKSYLTNNYYAYSCTYRELSNPELSKVYLDSCFAFHDGSSNILDKTFLKFEKAHVLSEEGRQEEALKLMQETEPWFLTNLPSYLVLVYTYWGDIYYKLSNYEWSKIQYEKALNISKNYHAHIDFTPLIYEKLSKLYFDKGRFREAYNNQQIAKELNETFFDSRSKNNWSLLEIKDEVRLEKERQQNLIQKQKLEKLEQQEQIQFLQRTILIGTIIFILLIGLYYLKNLRSKHKLEKEQIRRNKEIEIQRAKDQIELQNKELATSALQLVEKNEFIQELKTKVRSGGGNVKTSEINKFLRTATINNNNNWEEFKLRFTSINEKFYHELTTQFPNLTQNDQKICALIKLNFSSKDMAKLLGISFESVHTSRYRLRKKMKLPKDVNLEDVIAAL